MKPPPVFNPNIWSPVRFSLPYKKYPDPATAQALINRVVQAVQSQPGVTSAAVTDLMPFGEDDDSGATAIEGVAQADSGTHSHYRNGIAGSYWRTMGIPLIEVRLLDDGDSERKQRVCVVDQVFARRYWPGRSALGHRLNDGAAFNKDEAFTIMGVVGTVKQVGLDDAKPLGTIYGCVANSVSQTPGRLYAFGRRPNSRGFANWLAHREVLKA